MNIILVGKVLSRPRRIELMQPLFIGGFLLSLALLMAAIAWAGFWVGQQDYSVAAKVRDQIGVVHAQLLVQEELLAAVRAENESSLDSLARRMGQLQAHSARLDTLGARLTLLADLDEGEFDFSASPALGGPPEIDDGSSLSANDLDAHLNSMAHRNAELRQQLHVLEELMRDRQLNENLMPEGSPVHRRWASSHFGTRIDPITGKNANHRGMDFSGKIGDQIFSVADGVVTWSGRRSGYGLLIEIDHGNGYSTRYAHNNINQVKVGQRVRRGDAIAKMGKTGRTTGPNVHFEVLNDGRRVNPRSFVSG